MTLSDYLALFPGSSREKTRLVELADHILHTWRVYSDPEVVISC